MFKFFFFLISSSVSGQDYCQIRSFLTVSKSNFNCENNQILFAEDFFISKTPNIEYFYDNETGIKIPKQYLKEIKSFVKFNCHPIKNNIKIKEIINPTKENKNEFKIKIVISCFYKL